MDTCVPSPNLMNTPFDTSPHVSIYDQGRRSIFGGGSKMNSMNCGGLTDEGGLLDDHIEDSSLASFVMLPELLSTMNTSSSSLPSTYQLESKSNGEGLQNPSSESALMQLNMDYDEFLSTDFLINDSNDSKFSFLDFDSMLISNPPSLCHTPVPTESKPDVESSVERTNFVTLNKDASAIDNTETDYLQKKFTAKANFPPRTSQPPVGIVAPVKIPEENKIVCHPIDMKMATQDSKVSEFKVAMDNNFVNSMDMSELSPQTVPSLGVSNAREHYAVKAEPTSPKYSRKRSPVKRFADDDYTWKDMEHITKDDHVSATKSKRRRCDSGSSGHTSEDGDEEEYDYNEYDSDDDDLDADLAHMKPDGRESLIGNGKKQKQYFWQYNVQAKGPKGTRLKLAVESPADPHVLNGFEDPVFDEGNTMVAGIRHGGKARKGDGNEVTPNPHKLFKIGHQLLRLNKDINACQLGSDVPLAKRNESRKEKNKLASRACRLKKKAQHEANKIKLHGLEKEHSQINNVLRLILPELRERAKALQNKQNTVVKQDPENSLTNILTCHISSNLKSMVAGNTTDFVNSVIRAVEMGDLSGGLNVKTRKT